MQRRVTILPLNKMTYRCVEPAKLEAAKAVAADWSCWECLFCIGVDFLPCGWDVRIAMEFVFGNVIICSSAAVAKAIIFDKTINVRTVTLEGDSYEPGGTLTGGSTGKLACC